MTNNVRLLPTIPRSIHLENRSALLRRWRLARSGELSDPRAINRWFPKQRGLFELLAVLDQEDVEQIAATSSPLFGLQIRCTDFRLEACADYLINDRLEVESVEESFLALSARLDAIKTSMHQACLSYDMTHVEAIWLSRFCPQELRLLARDPALVMVQVASQEFFTAAATRELNAQEQMILCTVSRRAQATAN